jgi:hypothetical protein
MLGVPVDPKVTSHWHGRTIAFSDVGARARWEASPDRYSANLPGFASGSSTDTPIRSSARIVAMPPAQAPAACPAAAAVPAPRPAAPTAAVAPPPAKPVAPPVVAAPPARPAPDPAFGEGDDCCPGGNCRLPGR